MRNWWRAFTFISILLVITMGLGAFLHLSAGHKDLWYRIRNIEGDDFNAVTVGNSHNSVVNFDLLGLRGRHFWLTDMDLEEIDRLLAALESTKLKYIFIHLSNGTLFHSNRGCSLISQFPLQKMRHRFYRTYDFKYYIGSDLKNYILAFFSIFIESKDLAYHWSDELSPQQKRRLNYNYRVFSKDGQMSSKLQLYTKAQLKEDVEYQLSKEIGMGKMIKECFPNVVEFNKGHIDSIIERAKSRSQKVIFYRGPVVREYRENYPQKERETASQFCNNISKMESVFCFDYSDLMPDDFREFEDSSHVNVRGIKRFSRAFREDLIKNGIQ